MRHIDHADQVALEQLVDRHGLYRIAEALAAVCEDKADHLVSNWQDRPAAGRWSRASNAISRLITALEKIQLP
jgi:hypothetical protein